MISTMNKEVGFTLPVGIINRFGMLQNSGRMKVLDFHECLSSIDPFVEIVSSDEAFFIAESITKLGSLSKVTPMQLQQLHQKDLVYLKKMFLHVHGMK